MKIEEEIEFIFLVILIFLNIFVFILYRNGNMYY